MTTASVLSEINPTRVAPTGGLGASNPTTAPDEPIRFQPIYKERVWGGRSFADKLGRHLPSDRRYGESWELCDRPDDQSIVTGGLFAGLSLHELWTRHPTIFGTTPATPSQRFPLLAKTLDARDDLSIQVHPPEHLAASLGGEPKAECWFIAHAEPGSKLYLGLKNGVTAKVFEAALHAGQIEDTVHSCEAHTGDFFNIPPGRIHAIGSGILIYEIQQNSDTTYRIFDWNRLGLDGKPRDLQIAEAMQCVDFTDFEPQPVEPDTERLMDGPHFNVEKWQLQPGESRRAGGMGSFAIITVHRGKVACGTQSFATGQFFIIPATTSSPLILSTTSTAGATILRTTLPRPP